MAIHHHWHIHVPVDDTLRDTLLGNDLDHFHYFFHDLWCWYADNLLHGALLNAHQWNQSHNFNDLLHDLRNVLNRHLRLAVWTQPPKITILAYINQFLSRRVDIECVRGITSSVSSIAYLQHQLIVFVAITRVTVHLVDAVAVSTCIRPSHQ